MTYVVRRRSRNIPPPRTRLRRSTEIRSAAHGTRPATRSQRRWRSESNPARIFRDQVRKSVGPFNHGNAVAEKIIIESQPFGRLSIFDAEKIEMINRQTSAGVFVNKGESRTGRSRRRA